MSIHKTSIRRSAEERSEVSTNKKRLNANGEKETEKEKEKE